MKALVTGASGFIGSTLIEQLDTLGFEVRALVRKPSNTGHGLKVQLIEGDLLDFDSLCKAVRDIDYIFHLAGVTQARKRETFFDLNAKGTEKLARAVAKVRPGLTRFVYVSSLAAAGPGSSTRPRVESDRSHPVSWYGKSKLLGEKELLRLRDEFPVSIVRPSVVYGPRDKNAFFMVQTIARNLMPVLQGNGKDGNKYYSVIHVEDLCRGLVQVALSTSKKVTSGELFYLSGDGVHTYQELVTMVAEKLNRDPLRVHIPRFAVQAVAAGLTIAEGLTRRTFPFNLDKLNEILPDYWVCSNQKAKQILGFLPEFDLARGLEHSIEWYKRQRWL